jgi:hypothetical protein
VENKYDKEGEWVTTRVGGNVDRTKLEKFSRAKGAKGAKEEPMTSFAPLRLCANSFVNYRA